MSIIIKGYYCDVLTDSPSKVTWSSGWRSNLIVYNCHVLLAAMMKGEPDFKGIMYLAAGSGRDSWDSARPKPVPEAIMLENEVLRRPISDAQISYLDSPDQTPTSRLEVRVSLIGADLVHEGSIPLREFGLFGGNASDAANSGYMINYVIHPRIDLTPLLTLNRTMHLECSEYTAQIRPQIKISVPLKPITMMREGFEARVTTGQPDAFLPVTRISEKIAPLSGQFGASLPVMGINGIGENYAEILREQNILTLKDLATMDTTHSIGKIPVARLKEFQTKSKLVMNMQLSLAPFQPLAGWTIDRLVSEKPEVLASKSAGFTPDMAKQLQEELSILQVTLDDVQLHELTLGDLMKT